MLKDGPINRFSISTAILSLRAVAPASICYVLARLLWARVGGRRGGERAPVPYAAISTAAISLSAILVKSLDVFCKAEALFFLGVYLPRRWIINRSSTTVAASGRSGAAAASDTPYMPLTTEEARRELFIRAWEATPDPRKYLSLYFYGADVSTLHRGDLAAWLAWRLWNREPEHADVDRAELEYYISYTEDEVLQCPELPEGRSGARFMAVTNEPVRMCHRPLLWYALVAAVDTIACMGMWKLGFTWHARSFEVVRSFPFRPLSAFASTSPSSHFSYWHLPHTSKDAQCLPVVFIHGIGVGLHFYLPLLSELLPHCRKHGIGIVALELLPVSNRITSPLPSAEETLTALLHILDSHQWRRCVLLTHSYGSVLGAYMLRDRRTRSRIRDLIFVDPVAFSFHPPEVAFNFLRRRPRTASERQLWYFASMDPDVAQTLTSRFRWVESSLWRENLEEHAAAWDRGGGDETCRSRTTVLLAGADIITDVETLGAYLTRPPLSASNVDALERSKWFKEPASTRFDSKWKSKAWSGAEPLAVVYSPGLNHAEAFEVPATRSLITRIITSYATGCEHITAYGSS
jgi:pimeloyl-ACP methyl ester carboxylesterase